jgi:hypothetical protein
MPGKMTNSILRPPFRPPQVPAAVRSLASILREGRKSAIIHLSSRVIWGIPAKSISDLRGCSSARFPPASIAQEISVDRSMLGA